MIFDFLGGDIGIFNYLADAVLFEFTFDLDPKGADCACLSIALNKKDALEVSHVLSNKMSSVLDLCDDNGSVRIYPDENYIWIETDNPEAKMLGNEGRMLTDSFLIENFATALKELAS